MIFGFAMGSNRRATGLTAVELNQSEGPRRVGYMTHPLPIACSLTGADFVARVAELRALGHEGLMSVSEGPGRAVLRFRPAADIRGRVEAAAAAESECCAFLAFRVDHGAEATTLTITAPNGGAEVVGELAAVFAGRR
jgi:hypothetical protein